MKTQDLTSLHLDLIEHRLHELIPTTHEPHSPLFEAARYSLLLPAKRFRPLLLLATLHDFQYPLQQGIDPACALEMVHSYSLIHDDLPCMDNDELRRGKPTLHKVYNEAQAILTGDYLLTYAFEILAKTPNLSPEKKIELIQLLATRSGGNGMIGGQVIDLLYEGKSIEPKTLKLMFSKKTAELLSVSLEFGAVIANLNGDDQMHLAKAGFALGMSYQYIDDLLDLTGSVQDLGKPIGSDMRNKKATALTLYSKEEVHEKAYSFYRKALDELACLSRPSPQVLLLFEKCLNRIQSN